MVTGPSGLLGQTAPEPVGSGDKLRGAAAARNQCLLMVGYLVPARTLKQPFVLLSSSVQASLCNSLIPHT